MKLFRAGDRLGGQVVIGFAEPFFLQLGGLAGLSLMLLGGWLGHAFYGQEKDAEWLRRERDEDVF